MGSHGGTRTYKKDVKNEDRTDYVHEKKRAYDKMAGDLSSFFAEYATFSRKWTKIHRALAEGGQVRR
jgi:hypothetical protein